MPRERILVIDDDAVAVRALRRILKNAGYEVLAASSGSEGLARQRETPCDVVVTDLVMEGMDGLETLRRVKEIDPDVEVIVLTGHASISTAIEATRNGAFHYIEKPTKAGEIENLVSRALERRSFKMSVEELTRGKDGEPLFVARDREMLRVISLLKQVAPTECNVLIIGESGTGKELAARLLHHCSQRSVARFMALNCGALTGELLANELFGHEKGAYTGAGEARRGLLEASHGGTLFLDEVADMPLDSQVKLLRAVELQEFNRVGGTEPVRIDVRVVAATHRDLQKAVEAGLFRHDLYYRLKVLTIEIPPLRKRKEDVPLLSHFFLNRASRRSGKRVREFSDGAMDILMGYDYPGNVRELENIIDHAVAMARGDVLGEADLPSDISRVAVYSFDSDKKIKTLRELERDYIRWVLDRVGRNKSKAAKLLGIDRVSLWRHLKRLEIQD